MQRYYVQPPYRCQSLEFFLDAKLQLRPGLHAILWGLRPRHLYGHGGARLLLSAKQSRRAEVGLVWYAKLARDGKQGRKASGRVIQLRCMPIWDNCGN